MSVELGERLELLQSFLTLYVSLEPGLERVAEELMGRRKWRQLGTIGTWDDPSPSATACPADGHPQGPHDFEPRQDLQCCFCDDPLDTSTV